MSEAEHLRPELRLTYRIDGVDLDGRKSGAVSDGVHNMELIAFDVAEPARVDPATAETDQAIDVVDSYYGSHAIHAHLWLRDALQKEARVAVLFFVDNREARPLRVFLERRGQLLGRRFRCVVTERTSPEGGHARRVRTVEGKVRQQDHRQGCLIDEYPRRAARSDY